MPRTQVVDAVTRALWVVALVVLAMPSLDAQRAGGRRGPRRAEYGTSLVAVQVALSRAGFSPGEIDGRPGVNTTRALEAFRQARGLPAGATVDDAVVQALGDAFQQPLVEYEVTPADLAGPFVESIPADMMQQATLDQLAYTSPWEMIGERFHASPRLLQALNTNVTLAPGVRLRVPAVEPLKPPEQTGPRKLERPSAAPVTRDNASQPAPAAKQAPAAEPPSPRDLRIEVSAADKSLTVRDAEDRVLFFAPVTVGGPHDPLPVGTWKVTAVYDRPIFRYNPDLFWDANPAHAKATIPPGPNNPVGLVWIGIDKENFGLHGTPEPSQIGRTQSHGCVRMTNWDALTVAGLVRQGTAVVLR
jgi:lipoprotein-anchoring transpeptidase ErfK/SrfK